MHKLKQMLQLDLLLVEMQ